LIEKRCDPLKHFTSANPRRFLFDTPTSKEHRLETQRAAKSRFVSLWTPTKEHSYAIY
jgi:hypothetical protein